MFRAQEINAQPTKLDLKLYSGNGVSLRLLCTSGEPSVPFPITGDVTAQIRSHRLSPDPPVAEFSVDLSEADPEGIVVISLTNAQTKSLLDHESSTNGKFTGKWDVEWSPTEDDSRTLIQGNVECVSDVSR